MGHALKVVIIKGPGFENLARELERLNIDYEILEEKDIDTDAIINEIRLLPPQVRGRVRYGHGKPLPITRSGRLNTANICIVLVYRNGKLVDVYPKVLGGRYIDVLEGVRIVAGKPLYYYLYEEPLLVLLSQHPELLGCARILCVKELIPLPEGGTAEVDLLLEDDSGSIVLVEVEENAKLGTIAQALSLAEAVEKHLEKPVGRIIVVALNAEEAAVRAARRSGVEICRLRLEKYF